MFESGKFILGLNYWANDNATNMWRDFDEKSIEKDLQLIASYGIKLLRVFPLWNDFQPINCLKYGGSVYGERAREVCLEERETPLGDSPAEQAGLDPAMLKKFRIFADIADRYGIKLIVAIMTVHMTGRHYVPRAMENMDIFSDPFALKWEMLFYREFVNSLKDHPAIAAWETGNEMSLTAPVKSAEHAWAWTNTMHNIIRLADPSRPVIGVTAHGLDPLENKWLISDQAELSDFTNIHKYDIGNAGAMDGFLHIRNLFRVTADCKVISDIGGKPCFIEETGNWRNTVLSLKNMGKAVNAIIFNAWRENCRALLWWCAFDQYNQMHAPYNWGDWPGLEHGVFSVDGKAHPAAESLRNFQQFLDKLPFDHLPELQADAVVLTDNMDVAFSTFLLGRQAGLNFKFHAARKPLPQAKVYFLPSVAARGGISSVDWEKLLTEVRENGAVCYISANDCNLPCQQEFCGMEIEYRRQSTGNIKYTLDGQQMSLNCPVDKKVIPQSAEVLLADSEGKPLLLRNTYGKGVVFTITFALEKSVFDTPRGFDGGHWQLYRRMIPKKLLLQSNDNMVIFTEHYLSSDSAAVVAVNASDRDRELRLTVDKNWHIEQEISSAVSDRTDSNIIVAGAGKVFIMKQTDTTANIKGAGC